MTRKSGESENIAGTLRRLEDIVRRLEAEETDLDQAIALFEEGVTLLRDARTRLDAAEVRVQQILEKADGQLGATDLDV
jgi:exodeoxyribonuclease VII small subunit